MKTRKILTTAALTLAFLTLGCEGRSGSSNNGSNNLPPDPGAAGKATLEGIDSNNNGIRDDVEIAIYEYAPKPEQEGLRQAMFQGAKSTQLAIIAGHTKDSETIKEAQSAIDAAVECLHIKLEHSGMSMFESSKILSYKERKTVNTPDRVEAYMRFNEALSGKTSSQVQRDIPCDYDREKEAKAQTAFEQSKSATWSIQSAFSNLPPDPSDEGKKTLEGIDSNNNGIRDDVEIAIYNYAPREDQESLRKAMINFAKSIQAAITADTKDISLLQKITTARKRANECLKLKSFRSDNEESKVVHDVVRNTKERKKAYGEFSDALGANGIDTFRSSGDPTPCDFDSGARNFYRY